MKGTLLSLAIVCSTVAGAQTKAPPPNAKDVAVPVHATLPAQGGSIGSDSGLTAEEAVRIALSKQPTLESARQAVIAADGRIKQVRAKMLPQLGVGGTYYSSRFIGNESNRLELNVPKGYGPYPVDLRCQPLVGSRSTVEGFEGCRQTRSKSSERGFGLSSASRFLSRE